MKKTRYHDLDLAIQGEIDHFIQTKILKWNEVERERRMRDPMFAINFEKIRCLVLGFKQEEILKQKKVEEIIGESQFEKWSAKEKFYYQDYAFYFYKIKGSTLNGVLNESEMRKFDTWCRETLAVNIFGTNFVKKKEFEDYLDGIKLDFFPFLQFQKSGKYIKSWKSEIRNNQQQSREFCPDYNIPDIDTFRRILFRNGVGYRLDEERKLYVQRFYLIPALLWPVQEGLDGAVSGGNFDILSKRLSNERTAYNQNENVMDVIFDEKLENLEKEVTSLHEEIRKFSSDKSDKSDVSTLHEFIYDDNDEVMKTMDFRDKRIDELFDNITPKGMNVDLEETNFDNYPLVSRYENGKEFQKIVEEFSDKPRTLLQMERELWFRQAEFFNVEDVCDESDVLSIRGSRVDQQLMTRAELSIKYEEKEACRRNLDWESRLLPWEKPTRRQLGQRQKEGGNIDDYFDLKLSLPTWNKDN